jgi:RNAse (barnase) inhibitor barstar
VTFKEEAHKLVESLPDDASWEDLMYKIYVHESIQRGLEDSSRVIRIDGREITDWASFHATFKRVFGFPDVYGRNGNAWIDCMTDLDAPEHGMTTVHVKAGETLTIYLEHSRALRQYPDILEGLMEMVDFVNSRRRDFMPPQPAILSVQFDS